MIFKDTRVKFLRLPWTIVVLVILLGLILTNLVSANSINDELMWVTVCHTPSGHPENAQTMVIYWSALDKCLSHFNDIMGPCP